MRIDVGLDPVSLLRSARESACSIIRKPPCRAQIIVVPRQIRLSLQQFQIPGSESEGGPSRRAHSQGRNVLRQHSVKLNSFAKLFNRGVQISLLLIGPAK